MTSSYSPLVNRLKDKYIEMPWYKRLFFPYQLASALTDDSNTLERELNVFNALNNTWSFQRWLFSSIESLYNHDYTATLRDLNTSELLTGKTAQVNFNAVVEKTALLERESPLNTLRAAGLLTGQTAQENFNAVVAHTKPKDVGAALIILKTKDLLNDKEGQKNFNAVVTHPKPIAVANALNILLRNRIFTDEAAQESRQAVLTNREPLLVASALVKLHEHGLLEDVAGNDTFVKVLKHEKPQDVIVALENLKTSNLLLPDNVNAVLVHQKPKDVANAIITIKQYQEKLGDKDLLTGATPQDTQDNRNAVLTHKKPTDVANAIVLLYNENILLNNKVLLTGEKTATLNRAFLPLPGYDNDSPLLTREAKALLIHQNPLEVAKVLLYLKGDLLNGAMGEKNFNAVLQHSEFLKEILGAFKWRHLSFDKDQTTVQTNFDAVLACEKYKSILTKVIKQHYFVLNNTKQDDFNALFIANTEILLNTMDSNNLNVWDSISKEALTKDKWEGILTIAKKHQEDPFEGKKAFLEYVRVNILDAQLVDRQEEKDEDHQTFFRP